MTEGTEVLKRIAASDYLYLAHPRESRFKIRDWELDFEERSGINLLNPFYEIDRKNRDIDLREEDPINAYAVLNDNTVEEEIDYIKKSSGVIAIVDGSLSYGTIQEMVYAEIFMKPLFSLITNGHENHPWLQYHSTEIFTEQNKLEDRLIEKYGNK